MRPSQRQSRSRTRQLIVGALLAITGALTATADSQPGEYTEAGRSFELFGPPLLAQTGTARVRRRPAVAPGLTDPQPASPRLRRQSRGSASSASGQTNASPDTKPAPGPSETENRPTPAPTRKPVETKKQQPGTQNKLRPRRPVASRQTVQSFMDARVRSAMSRRRIPGAAIAIVRGERVYMLQGYGSGDLNSPLRKIDAIRTRFPVGQISATITAAAGLHAIDRGQLDASAPADSYLNTTLPRPFGKQLRINDLLRRETGFAALQQNGGYASAAEAPTLARYVQNFPEFRRRSIGPSDYEFALLGYILERRSGRPFAQHLERDFFRAIGMNESSFRSLPAQRKQNALRRARDRDIARFAKGYRLQRGQTGSVSYSALPERVFAPAPALGLYSSAGDMSRFMVMLLNEGRFGKSRLLSKTAAKRILSTEDEDRFLQPGYRFALQPLPQFDEDPSGVLLNYGDLPGYTAVLCLDPISELGLFLVANRAAPEFRDELLRAFLNRFIF